MSFTAKRHCVTRLGVLVLSSDWPATKDWGKGKPDPGLAVAEVV